ncbi:MAG TPA: pyruvate formate lyase-activating protein [Chloroflexi bacterium]|nr:pyruvate formate lyase-activating protein [Chloroflexota bacterium]
MSRQFISVDIGTGTQDIFLLRSGIGAENGFKLVMPSPTMIVRGRIQDATRRGVPLLLRGVSMGGGPCHWAAKDHLRAGLPLFATPDAARTFNDDLEWVEHEMGVQIVSEDEAFGLANVDVIEMRDFEYAAIEAALRAFGVQLSPSAIVVGVFDHGAAPPGVSDRIFRFEYLERRILESNRLSAFAYPAEDIPAALTRMRAVAASPAPDCPLIVMDNAPAAVLGALLDPTAAGRQHHLVANVGNLHTLAFRLGPGGVEGLFEHHTGLIDRARLEVLLEQLAHGTLSNDEIFDENGHGGRLFVQDPTPALPDRAPVLVTGPRRRMLRGSRLLIHDAAPLGDMMLAGCFGLLLGAADHLPRWEAEIRESLSDRFAHIAPWDVS